jgi:hypothetical protein
MPQACHPPALTDLKFQLGGVAWPQLSAPQQSTIPALIRPQACAEPEPVPGAGPPALTEVKLPSGAVAWPSVSEPQHTTSPPMVKPQV